MQHAYSPILNHPYRQVSEADLCKLADFQNRKNWLHLFLSPCPPQAEKKSLEPSLCTRHADTYAGNHDAITPQPLPSHLGPELAIFMRRLCLSQAAKVVVGVVVDVVFDVGVDGVAIVIVVR